MPRHPDAVITPNHLIKAARLALLSPRHHGRRMSRSELAEVVNHELDRANQQRRSINHLYVDDRWIGKLERGETRWPHEARRAALRRALQVGHDDDIGLYSPRHPGDEQLTRDLRPRPDPLDSNIAASSALEGALVSSERQTGAGLPALPSHVRRAILGLGPAERSTKAAHVQLTTLRRRVLQIHYAYQRADYDQALSLVPTLMGAVAQASRLRGDRRRVTAFTALAHLAVSKLALKFGDSQLAWLTADRARVSAADTEVPAISGVAAFSIASALLAMPGRGSEAAAVVEDVLVSAAGRRFRSPSEISAVGAVTLLGSVACTRAGDHASAEAYLRSAARLASRLRGDRNDLWTAFGPTNVVIHRVGITAERDPRKAIALGQRLDVRSLPPTLASRRSQLHLDLASAFSRRADGDASALLHLLEVERLAPQLLQIHPPARATIHELIRRERRAATPGLRELAQRVGINA